MKLFSIAENKQYVELSSPLKVYLDITTNCNLNCVFCFKGDNNHNVSFEQIKILLNKISDANIPDVVFIGGEPMCCPYLFESLEYAKSLGINPGIITNGTLFNYDNACRLKKLVKNSISVSVHAPNNELHDAISMSTNVYSNIINGLKILNSVGITPEISFTPVKQNVNHLYQTVTNIISEGIKVSDLLVNRLIPAGNAIDNWGCKCVNLDDQNRLFEQMEKLSIETPNLIISTGDAIPYCSVDEKYHKFISRCDYAITLGWINEEGLLGKCMVRGANGAQSIMNSDIRTVWKSSPSILEHRKMSCLPKSCLECDWLIKCGGGCSCSGVGNEKKDSFLTISGSKDLPIYDDKVFHYELTEDFTINWRSKYELLMDFYFRKENNLKDIYSDTFLLIPSSDEAIIQDIIKPSNGNILWVNQIEKQIIIYLRMVKDLHSISKYISYEFQLSKCDADEQVKKVVSFLLKLKMVKEL